MSGKLVMNALVMYDHQTDSLWSHFTGDAIEGDYLGTRLELVPSTHTTWGRWKELHPDTLALDKGGRYSYDNYTSYYRRSDAGVIGETVIDDRLATKDLVVGLVIGGEAKAYAFDDLAEQPVVNDTVGGSNVVVVFDAESETGNVFSRDVDGRTLEFRLLEDAGSGDLLMEDLETGTRWLLPHGGGCGRHPSGGKAGADALQLLLLVCVEGLASLHRPVRTGRRCLLTGALGPFQHSARFCYSLLIYLRIAKDGAVMIWRIRPWKRYIRMTMVKARGLAVGLTMTSGLALLAAGCSEPVATSTSHAHGCPHARTHRHPLSTLRDGQSDPGRAYCKDETRCGEGCHTSDTGPPVCAPRGGAPGIQRRGACPGNVNERGKQGLSPGHTQPSRGGERRGGRCARYCHVVTPLLLGRSLCPPVRR